MNLYYEKARTKRTLDETGEHLGYSKLSKSGLLLSGRNLISINTHPLQPPHPSYHALFVTWTRRNTLLNKAWASVHFFTFIVDVQKEVWSHFALGQQVTVAFSSKFNLESYWALTIAPITAKPGATEVAPILTSRTCLPLLFQQSGLTLTQVSRARLINNISYLLLL